ncbi:hypothetical protein GP486_007987 [Trichoglossum hirsutum]|uniref:Uncharacterized protein n=1 Tax=Trichoglossum hirsutum TaxID=265104 RepID=A0A9P8IEW3_9PEZI|nr:hypothetical protein GP486_007987 [Trichoglossum hirsutum]
MHDIERELIEITGYKVKRDFENRQDYLRSLFTSVQQLTDDDFDTLSLPAAKWANTCVEVHNNNRQDDLPDFDEIDDSEDPEEDEVDEEAEDEPDEDEPSEDEDPEDEESEDEESEDEAEPEPEDDEPLEDEVEEPKPIKKKPKPAKVEAAKAPKKVVTKAPPKAKKTTNDDEEEVTLDKWGCMAGSKNSQALALFEQGATAAEVSAAIGGTYYNILSKMAKQGHKINKVGAVIQITHMFDKPTKVSSPKKSKK